MLANQKMKEGYTTGSCAAAATKAAVLAARDQFVTKVEVLSPQKYPITVPIAKAEKLENGGRAYVIKDGGDDPDITHGTEIEVTVELTNQPGITIRAGKGVGTVTKPGLSVSVGEPAVNPGPRKMIELALAELLPPKIGAIVTISVPQGEVLAKKTLNPMLGIEGGISIIGTSGIVKPMSEEAFKNSLTPQISVVKALGHEAVVFVPGRIGQDAAVEKLHIPLEFIVQTSNFIGHMLENAVQNGLKEVLLVGHLGKLAKVAAGIFHTHNRMADGRLETIAAYSAALGAPQAAITAILDCTTAEAAMSVLENYQLEKVYEVIAARAS